MLKPYSCLSWKRPLKPLSPTNPSAVSNCVENQDFSRQVLLQSSLKPELQRSEILITECKKETLKPPTTAGEEMLARSCVCQLWISGFPEVRCIITRAVNQCLWRWKCTGTKPPPVPQAVLLPTSAHLKLSSCLPSSYFCTRLSASSSLSHPSVPTNPRASLCDCKASLLPVSQGDEAVCGSSGLVSKAGAGMTDRADTWPLEEVNSKNQHFPHGQIKLHGFFLDWWCRDWGM